MNRLREIIADALHPIEGKIESWSLETDEESEVYTLVVIGRRGKCARKVIDYSILESILVDGPEREAFCRQVSKFSRYFG